MISDNKLFRETLSKLDYDEIIASVIKQLDIDSIKIYILHERPAQNIDEAIYKQNLTADALSLLNIGTSPVFSGLSDIRPYLKLLSLDNFVLSIEQLYKIKNFMQVLEGLKKYSSSRDEGSSSDRNYNQEFGNLYLNLLHKIENYPLLTKRLAESFESENRFSDKASVNLASIRHKIKQEEKFMQEKMRQLLQIKASYLQDNIITARNNRPVFLVKEIYRHKVPGIVHDISSSGQSLFIEPMEIVERSNKIAALEAEERLEVDKILADISGELRLYKDSLCNSYDLICEAGAYMAKALWAIKNKCRSYKLNDKGQIKLVNARHPLLDANKVVPININLGYDFDCLLITGPNTGGKTLALKTVGIFSFLLKLGFLLPLEENSKLAFFDKIFFELGDSQSIAQNLSSFSAHMKNLIAIDEATDDKSLILCDEIGSGTDPLEGAMLARVILEQWRKKGAKIIASSHYRELKEYALLTDKVENAACAFDEKNMQALYKISIGQIGVSHAFSISARLGLKPDLISEAKKLLSKEDRRFESLIRELDAKKTEYDTKTKALNLELQRLKEKEEDCALRERKLRDREEEFRRASKEKIRDLYGEKIAAMDSLLAELSSSVRAEEEYKQLLQKRHAFKTELGQIEDEITEDTLNTLYYPVADKSFETGNKSNKNLSIVEDEIIEGNIYLAPALNLQVKILSKPNQKGLCRVCAVDSNLMMSLHFSALTPVLMDKSVNKSDREISGNKQLKNAVRNKLKNSLFNGKKSTYVSGSLPAMELMLLGYTKDEALQVLDKHLDQLRFCAMTETRIVHGKGNGILRAAVHSFLKKDSRISEFYLAPYGQGDAGVTIVKLK